MHVPLTTHTEREPQGARAQAINYRRECFDTLEFYIIKRSFACFPLRSKGRPNRDKVSVRMQIASAKAITSIRGRLIGIFFLFDFSRLDHSPQGLRFMKSQMSGEKG